MKKIIFTATAFSLLTILACKKERNQTATVLRDCTGTYLRFDGKDYQVCNTEKTVNFSEGTTVIATFREIKKCDGAKPPICYLLHKSEGWIEVEK